MSFTLVKLVNIYILYWGGTHCTKHSTCFDKDLGPLPTDDHHVYMSLPTS